MANSSRRRAFGQHFLNDEKVISRIVDTTFEEIERTGARALLEVGPGRGAITSPLLKRFAGSSLESFVIVEKDERLADFWVEEGKRLDRPEKNLRVLSADFLKVPAETYLERLPLVVVSNLPYSSGTAILQDLAIHPAAIPSMVLMFQAEVAARLRARPGDKAWGSLALWIQNRWDVKKLLAVPPNAFTPPPEVNSEVVILHARTSLRIAAPPAPPGVDSSAWDRSWEENWEKLIRIPFLHRRKMLRSGLPKGSVWKEALDAAGIEGTRRAEELDWNDWEKWMAAVQSLTFKFKNP